MTYQHKGLKNGGWNKLSLMEQMANIGSEVERAIKWRDRNKNYSKMAFHRALELLEITIDDKKNLFRLKEIIRVYEVLVDFFAGENKYKSSDLSWKHYFYPYNFAVRTNRL
ncbi:MAG: hypothetical protein ACD_37C00207G0003 [uncultured bacterium]|nr:MAG: hypothetical protein ACD_37C00207G0003 [uncultured bacterium]